MELFVEPEKASEFFGAAEPSIPELIRKHDRAQTPIHTIALSDPKSKNNMAEIAYLTGGHFRYVPRTDREYREMSVERRAASWLRLAKNHESGGRADLAEHYYRRIVSEYPATTAAEEVRRRN